VWALIGSSTIRRRGLTFDGGVDLALFDNQLREGRGAAISELRRQSMAVYLGATDPKSGGPNPTFVRLLDPHIAFAARKELRVTTPVLDLTNRLLRSHLLLGEREHVSGGPSGRS
jgi:hypothetical protein